MNKIINEIKKHWLSILGFFLIFCAWIAWLGQTEPNRYWCWILLGLSLLIEWILIKNKKLVISHWIQKQWKPKHDLIALGIMTGVSIAWIHFRWVFPIHNHQMYQAMILWALAGHFFAHGD